MFELKAIILFSASLKLILGILLFVYSLKIITFKPTLYVALGNIISGLGFSLHAFYPYPIEIVNLLFLNLTIVIGDGLLVVGLWELQKKKFDKVFFIIILTVSLFQTYFFTEVWRHDGIRVAINSIIYALIGLYVLKEFAFFLRRRIRSLYYTIGIILITHCSILVLRAIFVASNPQIDLMAPSTIGIAMFLYVVLGQTTAVFCYVILVNQLLREELALALEKQKELQEYKDDLTSMIVHDLKNPLNALINTPEIFEGKQLINFVQHISHHMLTLVSNMLDINKYEENQFKLQRTIFKLNDSLEKNLELLRMLFEQKNITIEIDSSSHTLIDADKDIFERVITNLLTNAIKFSPNNSTIRITTSHENGFVKICVIDSGEGIAPENHSAIFEKYVQLKAKKSGVARSTGLGLPFCKIALEAHGGEIGVISDLGKGSTFWVTFPLATNQEEIYPHHETLVTNNLTASLTQSEAKLIGECAKSLKDIQIFELTSIKNELAKLNSSDSQNVKQWTEQVLNAVYAGNDELYKSLISNS
jgi:signal transduction histidine kinase